MLTVIGRMQNSTLQTHAEGLNVLNLCMALLGYSFAAQVLTASMRSKGNAWWQQHVKQAS